MSFPKNGKKPIRPINHRLAAVGEQQRGGSVRAPNAQLAPASHTQPPPAPGDVTPVPTEPVRTLVVDNVQFKIVVGAGLGEIPRLAMYFSRGEQAMDPIVWMGDATVLASGFKMAADQLVRDVNIHLNTTAEPAKCESCGTRIFGDMIETGLCGPCEKSLRDSAQ